MPVTINKIANQQRFDVTGDPTVAGAIPAAVNVGDTVYRADTGDEYLVTAAGLVLGSSLDESPVFTSVTVSATATITGKLTGTGTVTAAAGVADGTALTVTPTAAANNDVLTVLKLSVAAGTPGSFTGLVRQGLSIPAFTVVGDTSPGNPVGISIGVITGTGASVASGLSIAPPTGASTNYLIRHTTAATFNVTDAGAMTLASTLASAAITVTSAAAAALAVGLAGATNPAFVVDSSTGSQAAGLKVTGATAAGTVAIASISSGAAANLSIDAKGTGTISIGATSTGAVSIVPRLGATLLTFVSTTAGASLNIGNGGTAPTAPNNGDVWIESNAVKVRLNGATVTVQTA